jgi:transmembrane sensor
MRDKRKDSIGEQTDDAIAEAAARWLARRDRGLSPAESAKLQHWITADPRHAAELARLDCAWREFDGAGAVPELAAMARELDRATCSPSLRRLHSWRRLLTASVAAIALLAGLAWWRIDFIKQGPPENTVATYHVLASVARHVALDDGSVAEVRDDGQLEVEFSATERRVKLVRGEAHFTVAKDASRPFLVSAGDTTVRAVGTAFNVRLEHARLEVLVTEGEVQVSGPMPAGSTTTEPAASVIAGQRAVIERVAVSAGTSPSPTVAITAAAPAEVEQTLAWQATRLVFDRTPLADAVDAFNHHAPSSGIKLVIGDPALRTRRLGGTFRAANVEGFVRLLERGGEVRAEQNGSEIVLLPAH